MNSRRSYLTLAVACVIAAPAAAHHSSAMFDTSTEITLEGIVTHYDWKNPHVYMAIETRGPDGARIEQQIEAGASSVLLPLGLTADALRPGDRVTVLANPNRRGGGRIVLGRELTKADGTVLPLFIGSRDVRAAADAEASSIEGTWFAPRPGFFGLNGARRSWQLTEKAQAALAAFDGTTESAHASCIPVTAPTLMVYPVITTVEVSEETVVFNIDWMTSRRVVYMDGRGHSQNGERTLHGHSIGHWEGDTLVVDTRLYADHREGLAFGIPSGSAKHTVERFALSADRKHLDYSIVLEDPEYLVEPVSYSSQWEYRPELEPTGLACELDVARRFLTED
jgi:hypothetical protein